MSLLLKSAFAVGWSFGMNRLLQMAKQYDVDDALSVVGLSRRATAAEKVLPAIGLVAVGAVIGAGAALVLAPSSGRELRSRVSDGVTDKVSDARQRLENAAGQTLGVRSGASHSTS